MFSMSESCLECGPTYTSSSASQSDISILFTRIHPFLFKRGPRHFRCIQSLASSEYSASSAKDLMEAQEVEMEETLPGLNKLVGPTLLQCVSPTFKAVTETLTHLPGTSSHKNSGDPTFLIYYSVHRHQRAFGLRKQVECQSRRDMPQPKLTRDGAAKFHHKQGH